MTGRPPTRRALAALSLIGLGALASLGLVACSGDDSPGATTGSTATTADPGLQVPVYSDPAQLITVEVGRRFAIMVPADPAHGWRWVVEPVDTAALAPLGSEFRDDPALLAQATTTTTAPPVEEPPVGPDGTATTTTLTPTTAEPTTTTVPGPLVQIVSYAGRADGVAVIRLRYEQVGVGADDDAQVLEFRVVIGTVVLPEAPETPDTTAS